MRISASRAVPSSTQRKQDFKKLRTQRTAESFSAQLSDKLRQPQASPDGIARLWANIFHSLRASSEAVVGFERTPKRNLWHDEECRAASAAKNDAYKRTMPSAATRAIVQDLGRGKRKRDALSDARRGSREGMSVRKSRCTGVGTMLRNCSKTSSVSRKISSPERHPAGTKEVIW